MPAFATFENVDGAALDEPHLDEVVGCNISKLTGILTNDYFRFVPAPPSGKFDHIYTDQELYEAFNLPQKYIDIIESVIKERK